ncbi:hypothetical protein Glove_168g27 [Diversispora epigaea]|uniref:Uncharacterized protein n=1 Tax=Diversispora epigaea TaxID=1348612 RepID=A0A397IZJ6_9GLOM|nr:hypothetical protein Glove_168g27 [Diversispora epigaea]
MQKTYHKKLKFLYEIEEVKHDSIAKMLVPYVNRLNMSLNPFMLGADLFKSAEEGNKDGRYNLSYCYYHGIGTTKNDEKAFLWYM